MWWTLLGLALIGRTPVVQTTFYPFAGWFERRHTIRIAFTGLAVAALSTIVLVIVGLT